MIVILRNYFADLILVVSEDGCAVKISDDTCFPGCEATFIMEYYTSCQEIVDDAVKQNGYHSYLSTNPPDSKYVYFLTDARKVAPTNVR
jgi:hypothetical protein